ncbi:histidine phosphatase family protein [Vibrio sp. HN007]|uniref:histidine phosphatase family protein n=1 Tax=Vibrio iocasae TaxID=3098914 RepID=UPI0035D512C9
MKLILVRHGQTEWNLERRIQGWKNSALTDDAKEKLSGSTLSELNSSVRGSPVFYSSDLGRAYESAQILAHSYSSNVIADRRLRERKLGVLEGKVIDLDQELMPFWRVYHNRYSEKMESAFGVESESDFESRILTFIEHLRQRHADNDNTIVIVSHGEWIRAFINIINGIPSWHKGRGIEDNGLPVILELPILICRETA